MLPKARVTECIAEFPSCPAMFESADSLTSRPGRRKLLGAMVGSSTGSSNPDNGGFSLTCSLGLSCPKAGGVGAPDCADADPQTRTSSIINVVWRNLIMISLRNDNGVPRLQDDVFVYGFALNHLFVVEGKLLLFAVHHAKYVDSFSIRELGKTRGGQCLQHGHVWRKWHGPGMQNLAQHKNALAIHRRNHNRHPRISDVLLQLFRHCRGQLHRGQPSSLH